MLTGFNVNMPVFRGNIFILCHQTGQSDYDLKAILNYYLLRVYHYDFYSFLYKINPDRRLDFRNYLFCFVIMHFVDVKKRLTVVIIKISVNNCPTRCDYIQFYYFSADSSTCFGWYPHPSSGAHSNCNYSIWHWSNRVYYRPLTWRSRNCHAGLHLHLFWCGCSRTKTNQHISHTTLKPVPSLPQ